MKRTVPDVRGYVGTPRGFGVTVLRGLAQVDFMPNALCGLFFTAALFAAGWQYGLLGLLGAAVTTGTAQIWGVAHSRIVLGLEGFNGALVGTSAGVFLGTEYLSTWIIAVVGSIATAFVTAALVNLFSGRGLPTFTFPFCITASVMTIGAPEFERLWHGRALVSSAVTLDSGPTTLGWPDLWRAFFANIGQIFFMPQWYVGLLFLLGILVASRQAAAVAALGSVVGIASAWALGSPADQIRQGLLGYNAVLVAMALCGIMLVASRWSLTFALIGGVTATLLTGALTEIFKPVGGHTLTWPYCLTTAIFLLAVPSLPKLRRNE